MKTLITILALVLLVVVIFIIALHPEICVFILVMGYVVSGLFYELLHRYPLVLLYRKIRPEKNIPLPSAEKRSPIDPEHTTVQGG